MPNHLHSVKTNGSMGNNMIIKTLNVDPKKDDMYTVIIGLWRKEDDERKIASFQAYLKMKYQIDKKIVSKNVQFYRSVWKSKDLDFYKIRGFRVPNPEQGTKLYQDFIDSDLYIIGEQSYVGNKII